MHFTFVNNQKEEEGSGSYRSFFIDACKNQKRAEILSKQS